MIKKYLFTLFVFSFSHFTYAEILNGPTTLISKTYDSLIINGPANLKSIKATSLEINGTLQFHNVEVSGNVSITGVLNGDEGKFGILKVTGPTDVDHLICKEIQGMGPFKASYLEVKNDTDIVGPFEASHSKLTNLRVTADKIILDDVSVDKIVIRKNSNQPTLILKGKTVVKGDIIFESGDGILKKEGSDVKIGGVVKGEA